MADIECNALAALLSVQFRGYDWLTVYHRMTLDHQTVCM